MIEDRVLVRKVEDKALGGIEIPEGTGNALDHFKGEVVCIGDSCKKVQEGDVVLFRDGYSKLTHEGVEYHVIREGNIVGKIKKHV